MLSSKLNSLNLLNKRCFYRNFVLCQKLQQVFEEQSFGLDTCPQFFSHSFIALSITRCSKSAQKFAVRVRQVTTVAMTTTQLVLKQFKNFLSHQLRIEFVAVRLFETQCILQDGLWPSVSSTHWNQVSEIGVDQHGSYKRR